MAWPDAPITTPDWVVGYVDAATLGTKITDRLNLLPARVGITGPTATGVIATDATGAITGGSRNTIGSQGLVKAGAVVAVYAQVTLFAAITVPADGNVANTPVAQIPSPYTPVSFLQGIGSGGVGPICQFVVQTNGQVQITATVPGASLAAGTVISFTGVLLAL